MSTKQEPRGPRARRSFGLEGTPASLVDFNANTRRSALQRAAESVVDLVVIGGGITGAGVLREAALAGYSAILLDKGDFASGTSSRSSKLIHGGVRYLQQGDVGLVREAARERARLHRMAPHLARPARMMIPATSRQGLWKVAAGLWTFDRLAGDPSDRHHVLDRAETRKAERRLRRADRLSGAVVFTEYVTDDARLVLETVQSAVAKGAAAVNYARVRALEADPKGMRVCVRDSVSGEDLVIRCRGVVNAGGPWMDAIRELAAEGGRGLLQLTRGIHLVIRRERLPIRHITVLRAPDGRSTFVVPTGAYVYIGTTDTHHRGEREEPGVSSADAEYLLDSVAATFDDAPSADDIIGTWSGVRPLLAQAGKAPSEISRRDEILEGPGCMVSIAGGKLTTYRRMAERVLDRVAHLIGRPPRGRSDSSTRPLAGGGLLEQAQAREDAPELSDRELEQRLWATYGVAAAAIIRRIVDRPEAGEPVQGLPELTVAEVEHAVRCEMALTLDDLLRRRSRVAMFDGAAAVEGAAAAASLMGGLLSWDDARRETEAESLRGFVSSELSAVRGTA